MFGIGNAPTGSKDPFALRRAANAIVKILAESSLPLSLLDLLTASGAEGENRDQVAAFLSERVLFYLKDVRGISYDVVNAVLVAGSDDVRDTMARAEALTAVRGSEDFAAVSAACKRMKNILRQAAEKGYHPAPPKLAEMALEAIDLWQRSKEIVPQIAKLRERRAYREALGQIATLRPTVDKFFDKVMVLDPNEKIRSSNLGLIEEVLKNFSTIADFSEIVTG